MSTKMSAEEAIAAHAEFKRGNLSGHLRFQGWGDLPGEYRFPVIGEAARAAVVYWVYSYRTPIAWVLADGTPVSPALRYSLTTTQHQHAARHALGMPGLYEAPSEGRAVPVGNYGSRSGW